MCATDSLAGTRSRSSSRRAQRAGLHVIRATWSPDGVVQFPCDPQPFLGDAAARLGLLGLFGAPGALLDLGDVGAVAAGGAAGGHREGRPQQDDEARYAGMGDERGGQQRRLDRDADRERPELRGPDGDPVQHVENHGKVRGYAIPSAISTTDPMVATATVPSGNRRRATRAA